MRRWLRTARSASGRRPVHDRMDLLAFAAAFTQPPDYLVARQRAVGDEAEQLEATPGGKLLGGKRQLRGVGQVQLPQGFADRQEAVVGTPPAVPGPGRHEADLGELLIGPVTLALDRPVQRLPVRLGHGPGSLAELLGHIGADRELDYPEPCLPHSTAADPAGSPPTQINLGYADGRRRGQTIFQHPKLLITSRDIAVSELRVQHDALLRPPAGQWLVGLEPLVAGQCFAFVGFDQRAVQGRHRQPPVRLEKSEQRRGHRARTGSAIAGMIALPGGRGWPAAASWNRASQSAIAEGDGTARRRGLRQRACSARRSARGSSLRSTSRITWTKPASCSNRSRSSRPSPPARFSTISATII